MGAHFDGGDLVKGRSAPGPTRVGDRMAAIFDDDSETSMSNRQIAAIAGVIHPTVAKIGAGTGNDLPVRRPAEPELPRAVGDRIRHALRVGAYTVAAELSAIALRDLGLPARELRIGAQTADVDGETGRSYQRPEPAGPSRGDASRVATDNVTDPEQLTIPGSDPEPGQLHAHAAGPETNQSPGGRSLPKEA